MSVFVEHALIIQMIMRVNKINLNIFEIKQVFYHRFKEQDHKHKHKHMLVVYVLMRSKHDIAYVWHDIAYVWRSMLAIT